MLGKIDTSKRREIGELALTIGVAYAAAGVHEVGGNNRGDEVEFFQRLCGAAPGDPWCACFVCACLVKGYARAGSLAEDRTALSGYVPLVGAGLIAVTIPAGNRSSASISEVSRAMPFLRERQV